MHRLLLLALALPLSAVAQTQTVLFPGQSGAELLASIRAAYRPAALTGTNDDLYSVVDRTTVNGRAGVVGVYTGLFVPFDCTPSCDPSQDVYNGGSPTGVTINQEHTWPQAQLNGSGSAASETDLHNLFPTQVGVNADRGNLPFCESDDALTTRWYRGAPPYTQTTIPTEAIDEYSELRSGTCFEPREDHKGNVARAVFYVEALYPEETNEAWFTPQMATLYRWHGADPISAADQARSGRVAALQSGKDNPFVLDSTLVRRAFFPQITVSGTPAPGAAEPTLALAGAHPFADATALWLTLPAPAPVRAELFDAVGRRVAMLHDAPTAGTLRLAVDGRRLAPGVYVVRVTAGDAVLTQRLVRTR